MLIPLWCLDIPLVALSWGVLMSALFRIPFLTFGPMLLLFGMVWSLALYSRVSRAMKGQAVPYAEYYSGHGFPMLLLSVCALLATLWLLFFCVGQYIISFFFLPLLIAMMSKTPLLRRIPLFRELCLSIAFVFACAVPSYYYSFLYSPLHMLMNKHLWCMVVLFFLFLVEKKRLLRAESVSGSSIWSTCAVLLFFAACLYKLLQGEIAPYDYQFYVTMCIAAAFLHVMMRMRSRMQEDVWFSFHWGLMAVPALLSVSLYAPETWFN